MKNIKFIFLLLLPLIYGCTEDSPLSDLQLTDPGLIRPVITISRSTVPSGGSLFSHMVWIYDKNNNTVNIQNGKVTINNVELSLKKESINNAPFYVVDPYQILPFEFNKTYTCNITLSDGKIYTSSVKSRSTDIAFFDVPAAHNKTEDMIIKWGLADPGENIKLTMLYSFKNDSSGGTGSRNINIPNPVNGQATVPKSYFSGEVYKATFKLTSSMAGSVDKNFMPGSKMNFIINISKETSFK